MNDGEQPIETPKKGVNVVAVATEAHRVQAAGKQLMAATQDLIQTALFEEPEFEEALLLSQDEVEKNYTAENAKQIEWRRKACVKLLGRQLSTKDIADILSMNTRTVTAVAAQEGFKIGMEAAKLSDFAQNLAGSFAMQAAQKAHEAGPKDLMIMHGIARDTAINLRAVAGGYDPNAGAIEVLAENPALVSARKRLAERNGKPQINTDETQMTEVKV